MTGRDVDQTGERRSPFWTANVSSKTKHQLVLVAGRPGWSLRRITEAAGIRRERAGRHLPPEDAERHLAMVIEGRSVLRRAVTH